ncbi:uncharacterized protein TRAVEDRAFT_68139 [Trametes versicolor FP-101664 SS1]|uniref:uncharacterized protein n=1 Tax=Trametes versicolor (strain FP-101664) TaxID=717944 RepID=UPI0004621FBF|nr:uncharacterized protein TRAVEDRAFT_68139 [Trametes versicolor FP-101664 SS1]EIW64297.1 hypothetical protein TRAVEDRAFT_68139 [Trametes versicolor FP-101664 SS1]
MLTQLPLSFPVPPPLLPKLLRAGVNGAIAERVSAAVAHSIQRLKGVFEIDYNRRLIAIRSDTALLRGQNTLSFIPATYTAVYRRAVSNWSSYVLNVLAPRVLRVQVASKQITAPVNAPRRKPFNQEAVPKLERFFEQNAFPSRLEKMELATESNMEYRQIHVWFQNRRSRFKKEGKVLPKSVQRGTLLEELENTVVECLLPACPEAVDDDDNDAPLVTSCEDVAYVSAIGPASATKEANTSPSLSGTTAVARPFPPLRSITDVFFSYCQFTLISNFVEGVFRRVIVFTIDWVE